MSISNKDAQRVLSACGYYKGKIDGIFGPQSIEACVKVRTTYQPMYSFRPVDFWKNKSLSVASPQGVRYITGAIQALLHINMCEPGTIDGYVGHNTIEALNTFLYKLDHGKAEVIDRTPKQRSLPSVSVKQSDVAKVYGDPQTDIPRRLTTIELPFTLRIDYNLEQKTNKITVHEKVAASLRQALIDVHSFYGMDEMYRLGIDRYAGAYNKRKMRGGTEWSMHAYGCAIDFYAQPNGLRMRCPEALFCDPEYKDFLDIMERNGWLPAIRLWGADAMHFQTVDI